MDGKTILLVEDEAILALSEKLTLEKRGYRVIVAAAGEKAVEIAAARDDIDLILMDIDLGRGIDGTEAAAIILEQKEIPLVFLSSHTEPEVVEKTEGITSYGYIVKNSGITVLLASIKMAFRLFEAKQRERDQERALRESEKTIRRKLDAILEPGGDPEAIELRDLLDLDAFRAIFEDFARLSGCGAVILDTSGRVLLSAGCPECPEAEGRDTEAVDAAGRAGPGESVPLQCRDGLRDLVTPLFVGDRRVGAISLGRFLYDDDALRDGCCEAPRRTREEVETAASLYLNFATQFARLGYSNLKLARVLKEHKENEHSLLKARNEYRQLFEAMSDGLVCLDSEGRVTSANPAAERILGIPLERMIGRAAVSPAWTVVDADGKPVPPDEHPAVRALGSGKAAGPFVIGLDHPDENRRIWLSITETPVFEPGEKTPSMVFALFSELKDRQAGR